MNSTDRNRVCPVENAGGLDNFFRKIFQNPQKILKPYIKPGMTILDVGCGPGFFSVEIARMLKNSGKVIAADLQYGMLDKIKIKIKDTPINNMVELHKCEADRIGVTTPVDFILAFYVVHEVPNKNMFFEEIKSIMRSGGNILIAEPNSHVTGKEFENMTNNLVTTGFEIICRPKILFSHSVVLKSL